jgi:mobilome CxxCx(11)CxxC protein
LIVKRINRKNYFIENISAKQSNLLDQTLKLPGSLSILMSEVERTIRQRKLDALVAIELHKNQIRNLQKKNRLIEALSIAVPTFYLTPRLLAKGTSFANFIDFVGEILAAILLVLSILKLVNKWQDDEIKHAIMSQRNADIAYEADRLLESQAANLEVVNQFLRRIKDVDAEDEALLLNIKGVDKKKAYRDALKKFRPTTSTPCPICGADPWKFSPGNCQACGGTPIMLKN